MNRDDLIRMAHEAGFHKWYSDPERVYHFGCIENFATLVAAAEREACASIVQANAEACDTYSTARRILESNAAAIRARGQT